VLFDGRPREAYDPAHLGQQIGWMGQDCPTVAGTLLDNLTLFRRGAVQDHALQLAGEIGLMALARRLPYGLETPVGGAIADALPDGLRQRIAVVRALAGRPPIVLIDDAGSRLDRDGDRRLKTMLAGLQGRATLLLSTHRPSLMALAQTRYRLADGRLDRLAPDGDTATAAGDPRARPSAPWRGEGRP
jgi:ABC-type protease/lipase transport system fused ATPase/permease subunit